MGNIPSYPPALAPLGDDDLVPIWQDSAQKTTRIKDILDALGNVAATQISYLALAAGTVSRSVQSRLGDSLNVRDFGASNTGTADCSAAFTAASAAGHFRVAKGTYKISANITINSFVSFDPGAVLAIQAGVTVTFAAGIAAELLQIFSGAGKVAFSAQPTVGHPEWWGASSSIDSFDSYAAIMACIAACRVTMFQRGDYYVSQRIVVSQNSRQLIGYSGAYDGTVGSASRLIGMFNDKAVLRLGPDAKPVNSDGSTFINGFPAGLTVAGLWVSFNQAPSIAAAAPIIDIGYIRNSDMAHCYAVDGIIGYLFGGAVDVHVFRCRSQRGLNGAGGGADKHIGFDIDGGVDIGAAGGNASLHLEKCTAVGTTAVTDCTGLIADKYFTDLWVEHFETSACAQPAAIDGQYLGNGGKDEFGNTDCLIEHFVCDGYLTNAIRIWNVNSSGSVEVFKPYCAPNHGVSNPAISLQGNAGLVNVIGGQLVMGNGNTAGGVEIIDCTGGGSIDKTEIIECSGVAVHMSHANGFDIKPQTLNNVATLAAAVRMDSAGSNWNYLQPAVAGTNGKVSAGIIADGNANNYNEINLTRLPSSILPSASAKLSINGAAVTTTGMSGLNMISGNPL